MSSTEDPEKNRVNARSKSLYETILGPDLTFRLHLLHLQLLRFRPFCEGQGPPLATIPETLPALLGDS